MLFRSIQLILVPPNSLRYKVVRKVVGIFKKQGMESDLRLIQASKLFDLAWYLDKNPDVAHTGVDPAAHYLRHGGFEGRDPSSKFCSNWYLETYADVKEAGLNPLVHYLRFGQEEGRMARPPKPATTDLPYKCPVCRNPIKAFLPLPAFYMEHFEKYGFPYTPDEGETINFEQYSCPHCGASDRDRLCACYLEERLSLYDAGDQIHLLDIAPSLPLGSFLNKFRNITHRTADLFMKGVNHTIDITNMPEIDSDSYDILICSHVLEHVSNDKKALSELYRVLKPGGWGIIMVPIILTLDQIDEDPQVTDIAERWRRFGQDDHVRLYSKFGFIERVESAGFRLKQLGIEHFGESAFRQYGITNKSVLYVAEKDHIL